MNFFVKIRQINKGQQLVIFAVSLIFLRLVLGADRDILAVNQPYDNYWFVTKALHFGAGYTHMAIAQLATYAIWLKGWSLLGVPARLVIDVAWISSVAYLGYAVSRFLQAAWPGMAIFIFLTFHPYGFVLFDQSLSENLLTVLTAVALGGFIEIWNLRDAPSIRGWRYKFAVCATAIAFALAYHTRKEGVVLLTALALLAVVSAFRREVFWMGERKHRLGYLLVIAPVAAVFIVGGILAGANYLRYGIFVRYELAAPGYTRAINTLNAIDPGDPTPKHVTITAQTRAKAYALSPTFAELKFFLDGPIGNGVAKFTEPWGAPGEIANGWFYWTLRDAAATAGWHSTPQKAEEKYNAIAREIETAFESGQLKKRSVILPFVDPDWAKWLPDLPAAIIGEIRMLVEPANASFTNAPRENATAMQYDDYVALVGRRTPFPRLSIAGWMMLPEGTWIGLGTKEDVKSWQVLEGKARSDVPGGAAIPFHLSSTYGDMPDELWVKQPNGNKAHISLRDLNEGVVKAIPSIQGAFIGVDQLDYTTRKHEADSLMEPMSKAWSWFGWALCAAGFITLWPVRKGGERRRDFTVSIVGALMLVAILSRVLLIAMLDASSWPGQQARYLLPAEPFFAVFGILGIWSALQLVKKAHGNPWK